MADLQLRDRISGDRIEELINNSILNITEIMDDLDTSQYECSGCRRVSNYSHTEAQSFAILQGIIGKLKKTSYLLINTPKPSAFKDPEATQKVPQPK